MNEATGRDEHSLACQRASLERFQIIPEHEHDVVDDFLREILPRSVDRHGAEVDKWLDVEVSRLIGWLVYQRWRLCGRPQVSLVPENCASPATESVACGTSINEDNRTFTGPRTHETSSLRFCDGSWS